MYIIVNCSIRIEVTEPNIIVKDKRLYNTKLDCYEGVDGDYVSFDVENNGRIMTVSGTVDGYTNGRYVKIRGVEEPYDVPRKSIQRVSSVSLCDDDRELIILRYYNDVPVGVLCKMYGMSRFALYRKINKILTALRTLL